MYDDFEGVDKLSFPFFGVGYYQAVCSGVFHMGLYFRSDDKNLYMGFRVMFL